MMAARDPVPVEPRRQQFADELRTLRNRAGLSGRQLVQRMGRLTQPTVSRIETGQQAIQPDDARAWVQACGVSAEQAEALAERAEELLTEARTYRRTLREGTATAQQRVASLEATTGTLRVFTPWVLHGLLQTAEYIRRSRMAFDPSREVQPADIAARISRQEVLYDQSKGFEFLITEAALRWRIGPAEMQLGQLDRISTVATLPNVAIGLIPINIEAPVWHAHGFVLYDDRLEEDLNPIVSVETATQGYTYEHEEEVAKYRNHFARLREVALPGADARELLTRIMADLRQPDA